MNRSINTTFYVIYDELSIVIVSDFNEACEYMAEGARIYGYASDEDSARTLMAECFQQMNMYKKGPL
ncbi:hypothetical protein [Paenibacillus hamazuiensis]|uniref:hypothetical protein n=1 Tax=Paenibacillus hamazuiensis TaxID=2936508 RepID=UPI00200F0805|nr:hypothetical protein [Paenibacillus hamazuiensis]